jgi:hypothetical protein
MNSLELAKDNISRVQIIAKLALEKELDQHFREVLLENDKKEAKRQEKLKKELGEFYALLESREGEETRRSNREHEGTISNIESRDNKEIREDGEIRETRSNREREGTRSNREREGTISNREREVTRSNKRCREDISITNKKKYRKLTPLPEKEDIHLLYLIEYQKNKLSATLLKQKEKLAQLRTNHNFDIRAENDLICNIDANRAMLIALAFFKYKSYINSKRTFRILDVETNIKYSIIRIKNIESKSKADIRNIIYSCLDQYNISKKCKLCNEIHNYPQLQQSYMPIICNNNEKLCIVCTKCVSDLAKKEHRRSIGNAVKAIKKNNIY